ncbi:MAG: lysophospholipase [Syntrophomonadaceae bacterium]|jgi:alpha/beta superfamily hydrolase|nr:lysophospholipase [Syntrophomonadaceae bacterium]
MNQCEKVTINNIEGLRLAALSFMPAECNYVVIICHGFRGTKENSGRLQRFVSRLNQINMGALAFDFTGNGESEGKFSEISLTRQVRDLSCVIDYVKRRCRKPIILLGRSFGGSTVAASAIKKPEIAAYIFWSTPLLLSQTFGSPGDQQSRLEIKNEVPLSLIEDLKNHDMSEYLAAIKDKPVLVVHGGADETVSLENVDQFKRHVPQAACTIVDCADHHFTDHAKIRDDLTVSWLKRTFLSILN